MSEAEPEERQPAAEEAEDGADLDLAKVAAELAARDAAGGEVEPGDVSAEDGAEGDQDGEQSVGDADAGAEEVRSALGGDDAAADGVSLPELAESERPLSGGEAYAAVEALLFASDRPVTPAQIGRALPRGLNAREVRKILKAIGEELASGDRGYELREIAGGWQLLTREKFAPYVMRLRKIAGQRRLSGSALETLAVVAYRQPVTRAEVERIRGVNCGEMLRGLMEKRLVRMIGRSEELGSPLLYGTTQEFLEHFGLAAISDLPRTAELGRRRPGEEGPAQAAAVAAASDGAAGGGGSGGAEDGAPAGDAASAEAGAGES